MKRTKPSGMFFRLFSISSFREILTSILVNRFQVVVFILQLFLLLFTLWSMYEMLGLLRILLR